MEAYAEFRRFQHQDLDRALAAGELALQIAKQEFGEDHMGIAIIHLELANAITSRTNGRFEEVERHLGSVDEFFMKGASKNSLFFRGRLESA